ncbi:CATION EFFLUX PROTEIN/ ZINC TRANSPORTER [Salix koriyanagi]|uniref:CATION EFFLUX PROTEIN/ ZINC TRANSPORTER n=1 Tax=Salix koriyanagi TaxID=2511006 RepID=A0A9Q1AMA8_9ROSI|nr:CATION EFFLUX PROTEIN/ ZINC TRANSPORTER [Salix koriyanagi]
MQLIFLSDVAAFAISLFSIWASGWEATPRRTYGYFRIEILGALISIQMIWLLAGILVYEAIVRLIHETGEVEGALMFAVATVGLLVNIGMAFMLGHDHGHGHGHGHGHEHGGHNHDHSDDGHEDHDHTHNHSHEDHDHTHNHSHEDHDHSHEDHDHTHNHSNEDHDHTHNLRLSAATHQGSSENNDEHHHTHGEDLAEPLLSTHTEVDNKTKEGRKQKKQRNVNIQGAYLHVLGDSIQSVGVMIGGAIIWYKPEWKIIDLICTLVFSVIVLGTTIGMIRNILEVLMESTPREIDATKLEQGLCEMDEVVAIHELHIWAITVGKFLLACHVMIKPDADADMVLDKVVDYIRREHNITHVTIQIERQ